MAPIIKAFTLVVSIWRFLCRISLASRSTSYAQHFSVAPKYNDEMSRDFSTLLNIAKVAAIVLLAANSNFAQDRKNDQDRPEHAALERLHPDLRDADPPKG